MNFDYYAKIYKNTLLHDVIPFWEHNSIDNVNGGYFTCLNRSGKVFDKDKFVWLQGRQAWTFSMLYNKVSANPEWLSIAKCGIDFLKANCMDRNGNFYFSTSSQGQPLIQPYNIFSDCFAAMAFGQYAIASEDTNIKKLARDTYKNILTRKHNPKGQYEKNTPIRPLKSFALPMILSNLVLELEDTLVASEVEATIAQSVTEVMDVFLDKSSGLIYEHVLPDGGHHDSFDGRLLNPGHGIEAMWFMMDIGVRNKDSDLVDRATDTTLSILEHSWDNDFGGILYFMDSQGHPPQQLEWDQKLWWVHLESLVALSKAYLLTRRPDVWDWYLKVHEYTWDHFPDPEYGEWFGYLNRQGQPLLDLKGGKWKGFFHLPRALFQCWQSFEELSIKTTGKNG